ncbi:putative protein N(5)-glutamine methyltransferase [Isoptericola halotolerans]|uniref:putative protein N(5)-glutamine methyltransferase n=1 Tax=Isoptericola halotolerans TaxID=300560 RepID=UPI00388D574C
MTGTEEALVARLRAAGCVFAEEEARLLVEHGGDVDALAVRRAAGEPLEHLLGWVELAGRRWSVGPGVFVPRRRSELLVRAALAAPGAAGVDRARPAVVLDLCCGCGAVGGAVASALPDVVLHASDVEPAAVAHARTNLTPLGGTVHRGDLFDPVPGGLRGAVDVLLCHAPYVPSAAIATMPPEAREHEPRVALDGGTDGLDVLRRMVAEAPGWLRPGGSLLFEVGTDQVTGALALVGSAGLEGRVVHDEDDDGPGGTVVVATSAGPSGAGAPG